jgi:NAD(P)-dependent dehydrogenase (short-subunit alcohol dehydrogenase family)
MNSSVGPGAGTLDVPRDLTDKVGLVTGGSVGIGFATARELGRRGAKVAISSYNAAKIRQAEHELASEGIETYSTTSDFRNPADVDSLHQRVVERFGPIDILVNCAALRSKLPAIEVTHELWNDVIGVNLRAPVFLSALVCPAMMARHSGKIINVVSILESRAAPARLPYTVSKAGLSAATRSLALEMAGFNVQVNAVAPGLVMTPALEPGSEDEKRQLDRTVSERIPMGRVATAAEVAQLIGFLACPSSDYITGQVFYIDGGMTLR